MALRIEKESKAPPAALIADRRLCLTADRSRVVEANDPTSAFLFAPVGGEISADEVARHHLTSDEGVIVLPPVDPAHKESGKGARAPQRP